MEISKENIIAAYKVADENGKRMLTALFGEEAVKEVVKLPVTERIKTFADACKELGDKHPCVAAWNEYKDTTMACESNTEAADITAYLKLRIICAALNEGWQPDFIEDEYHWYPWFYMYTQEEIDKKNDEWKQNLHLISTGDFHTGYDGFACAYSSRVPSDAVAHFGSRLCLKSEALATYCGMHFIQLWADFNLIRKAQEVADNKTVTAVDKAAAAIAQATGAAPANVDPETGENKEDKKQAKTTTKK